MGKFGVGLKDAPATFDRHRIAAVIGSAHGDITTGKQAKHGFADIKTLHALITEPAGPGFAGTEFILHGDALGERQVEEAKALFLRYSELADAGDFVQRARDDGYEIIVVPETIRRKLPGLRDALGNPIRDLDRYRTEWQDSFRFAFIDPADFSYAERAVWDALPQIFTARGGRPRHVRDVRISETMRLMEGRYQEAVGVWDPGEGWIIVKRTQLQSLVNFAGTVLHELSHALSGAPDMTLEFEQQLTEELGGITARTITSV